MRKLLRIGLDDQRPVGLAVQPHALGPGERLGAGDGVPDQVAKDDPIRRQLQGPGLAQQPQDAYADQAHGEGAARGDQYNLHLGALDGLASHR